MHDQRAEGWTRRTFLRGLTLAGTAGLLGLRSRPVAAESLYLTASASPLNLLCTEPLISKKGVFPHRDWTPYTAAVPVTSCHI